MLTYMKHEAGRIESVNSLEESRIVRAVAPTPQEISLLQERLGIPADFLHAAMDRDERPRIEVDDPCKLLILRIPHHDETSDTPYVTVALALILTPSHIVTVCSLESMLWNELLTSRHRLPPPTDRVSFLSSLFLHVARQYLGLIRKIKDQADAAERAIHGSMRNEMLIRMLNLEKCLVFFTTSLRANEPLWDRFRRIHGRELTEEERDLIDDVKIDARLSFEDVIEPVIEAKQRYGDRIALLGGIDLDFLCRADEAAVRRRVRATLDACHAGGGYCLGTGNSVANYIPLDNYLAMLDEGRRYTS